MIPIDIVSDYFHSFQGPEPGKYLTWTFTDSTMGFITIFHHRIWDTVPIFGSLGNPSIFSIANPSLWILEVDSSANRHSSEVSTPGDAQIYWE